MFRTILDKEDMVAHIPFFRHWVGSAGDADNFPFFLKLKGPNRKPGSPFKFNSSWLKDMSYNKLVHEIWSSHNGYLGLSLAQSFMEKLKKLKQSMISWAKEKSLRDEAILKFVEIDLEALESLEGDGYEMEEKKRRIKAMEGERYRILKDNEEKWRLKSRDIWLEAGDENSKFFQNYAKGRKNTNTIWELKNDEEVSASSFNDLSIMGVSHFKTLFKAPPRSHHCRSH